MSLNVPTTLPFRHLVHSLQEPEDFSVAVSRVSLHADFFAPQDRPTQVEQFQTNDWSLDFHEAHVRARVIGPLPPRWASVGVMRAPVSSAWYGIRAQPGTLACTPPGSAIEGWFSPGFACVAVSFSAPFWDQCQSLAGAAGREFGGATVLHLPQAKFRPMEQRIQAIRRELQVAVRGFGVGMDALRSARDLVFEIGVTAWEMAAKLPPIQTSLRNRARLARRAEDWMRAHLTDPVRVPEVCTALGVSRRELEYAVRTVWDQSPRDLLHTLRLNAIRRALRHGSRSITEIALDHGVTHLGRFSAQYRAIFAQSPSETRTRAV